MINQSSLIWNWVRTSTSVLGVDLGSSRVWVLILEVWKFEIGFDPKSIRKERERLFAETG